MPPSPRKGPTMPVAIDSRVCRKIARTHPSSIVRVYARIYLAAQSGNGIHMSADEVSQALGDEAIFMALAQAVRDEEDALAQKGGAT